MGLLRRTRSVRRSPVRRTAALDHPAARLRAGPPLGGPRRRVTRRLAASSAATAEGVAWRPDPGAAPTSRLARFLRATGEPTLDGAAGAGGRATRAGSGAPAADDIGDRRGSAGHARVLDASRRAGLGTLVDRRGVRLVVGGGRAPRGPRPGRHRAVVGGRGRRGPDADERRAGGRGPRAAAARSAALGVGPGDRVGILLPMLPETVVAVLARRPARGDLHADLLGLRARRPSPPGSPTAGARLLDHRRRLPAARRLGRPEGGRRRGGRRRTDGRSASSSCGGRGDALRRALGRTAGTSGGTSRRRRRTRPHGPGATRCADATPRRRTCSSTRRARPAGRRAPSTSTAASRSRPPRTSPTRST